MSKVMCYDNETIKWNHNGVNYCVHIRQETNPQFDPRPEEHDSVMVCFGQYSNYGDYKEEKTEEEFWNNLVWGNCSDEEILDALVNDKLHDTHARKEEDGTYHLSGRSCDDEWIPYCWGLKENEIFTYVKNDLSIADCMVLMEPHAVWLPLFIYDHGGVSMSCGGESYPYNDRWDSSQVGWILTVTNNREHALKQMIAEVNEYDDYLCGDVYWYTTYRKAEDSGQPDEIFDEFADGWVYIDDCGGFIGNNIIENNMAYTVGFGLEEAIKNGNYELGEAKKTVVVKWEF